MICFFARNLLDYSFESSDYAHVRCPKLPNISKYMHIRLYHHYKIIALHISYHMNVTYL